MKIGDRVTRIPLTFGEITETNGYRRIPRSGTVVYIHPKGRYHVVAFPAAGGGVLRESFKGV